MAEPVLPQKPETTQRLQNEGAKRDTAPILVPAPSPAVPPRRSPPPSLGGTVPRPESPIAPSLSPRPAFLPVLHPLPKPAAVPPEDLGDISIQPSPKKETARITILPRPSPSPAIAPSAPGITATSKTVDAFDSIPRWFCWGLLGLSALIFLTQIWNYALS